MASKIRSYVLWANIAYVALGAVAGAGTVYLTIGTKRKINSDRKPDRSGVNEVAESDGQTPDEMNAPNENASSNSGSRGDDILNFLCKIGEVEAKRAAVVHRYVTCNVCGVSPIKGIRFKCGYCSNFDLCEACELDSPHPKTHLLLKIRIPTPPLLSATAYVSEFLYPGSEAGDPINQEKAIEYAKHSHFNELEVLNLHNQFICLSDISAGDGGISFSCFQRLFPKTRADHADPARTFFNIIDRNKDSIITFDEFLSCLSVAYKGTLDERIEYAFVAYDSDGDGIVTKEELLYVIKAYHVISVALIKDFMRSLEKSMLDVFDDKSSNTVSSVFGGPIRSYTGADAGRHGFVSQDVAGKSSSDSCSDYEVSSPMSLASKSDSNESNGKRHSPDENPRVDSTAAGAAKRTPSELISDRGDPKKVKDTTQVTSAITSQLESIHEGLQWDFKQRNNQARRKDSLLVNNFTESAIRLEVEQIFLKASSLKNSDGSWNGINRKLFSSLSLQEPNIINAVFDSITCIF